MHSLFVAVLGVYLVATLFYLMRLVIGHQRLSAIALRVTVFGALFQTVVLILHVIVSDKPHILTYLDFFQFSALLLADLFIVLCFTKKFYGSGPFFITLIDVFCIMSLTMENQFTIFSVPHGAPYLYVHLLTIFLALSVYSIAFITAIMFLISDNRIKNKNLEGILLKFPSLAVLEEIHFKALNIGFVIFTFVIITGTGFSKINTGHYISGDAKQILSFISWLIFAAIINFRVYRGWQGRKGILLSCVGFVAIGLAFFVGLA